MTPILATKATAETTDSFGTGKSTAAITSTAAAIKSIVTRSSTRTQAITALPTTTTAAKPIALPATPAVRTNSASTSPTVTTAANTLLAVSNPVTSTAAAAIKSIVTRSATRTQAIIGKTAALPTTTTAAAKPVTTTNSAASMTLSRMSDEAKAQANNDPQLLEFIRTCTVPFSIIRGKIHSIRQLNKQPPPEYIPESILKLKERYDTGVIVKGVDKAKWYRARKRLKIYKLLKDEKKKRRVTNAQYCKRWRQQHIGLVGLKDETLVANSSATGNEDNTDVK